MALAGWLCDAPASAQYIGRDPLRVLDAGGARLRPTPRWDATRAPTISLVDLGAGGPRQRSRTALRVRLDMATRAMRGLGVDADDCSSLVRSSTRMRADEVGGTERLQVSVSFALSCSFF